MSACTGLLNQGSGIGDQSGEHLRAIHARDPDPFRSRALAAHDRDVALGNLQAPGEEGDELVVGGAIDRRRGQPDEEGAVAQAGESAAARAGNDLDVEVAMNRFRPLA
jgi:hypothetical protein